MVTALIEHREDREGREHRETNAAEYLESMQSLTGELERAMQAIAHNALSDFEESIQNQHVLSTQLSRLAQNLCSPGGTVGAAGAGSQTTEDADMMHRIHQAAGTLQKLNRRYAALIQHSSHSAALMASLFSSFTGQFQEASGPRLKRQTWSCQM